MDNNYEEPIERPMYILIDGSGLGLSIAELVR